MARKATPIDLAIGTAEGRTADPVATAASLHFRNRAEMVPCYVCGLPHHRARGLSPSGAIRRGTVTIGGRVACEACSTLASAGDAGAIAARAASRVANADRVATLWAAREAREAAE